MLICVFSIFFVEITEFVNYLKGLWRLDIELMKNEDIIRKIAVVGDTVNPGKHNIYGFMGLKPNSYSFYFPNSGDINSDTMLVLMENLRCKDSDRKVLTIISNNKFLVALIYD